MNKRLHYGHIDKTRASLTDFLQESGIEVSRHLESIISSHMDALLNARTYQPVVKRFNAASENDVERRVVYIEKLAKNLAIQCAANVTVESYDNTHNTDIEIPYYDAYDSIIPESAIPTSLIDSKNRYTITPLNNEHSKSEMTAIMFAIRDAFLDLSVKLDEADRITLHPQLAD